MARYTVVPDRSRIWIDARSSLHPIHVEATGLEGFLDADVDAGGWLDLAAGCSGRLEVPVDALRSGNALVDRETARRLASRRYPLIVAQLERLEATSQDGCYGAAGSITLRDRTRRYAGRLQILAEPDGTLLVTGAHPFDVRDLDLQPPRMLMLEMQPDVAVRVEIRAAAVG